MLVHRDLEALLRPDAGAGRRCARAHDVTISEGGLHQIIGRRCAVGGDVVVPLLVEIVQVEHATGIVGAVERHILELKSLDLCRAVGVADVEAEALAGISDDAARQDALLAGLRTRSPQDDATGHFSRVYDLAGTAIDPGIASGKVDEADTMYRRRFDDAADEGSVVRGVVVAAASRFGRDARLSGKVTHPTPGGIVAVACRKHDHIIHGGARRGLPAEQAAAAIALPRITADESALGLRPGREV